MALSSLIMRFFLAKILPQCMISAHFSVVLLRPCDIEENAPSNRRLKLDGITDEQWDELNDAIDADLDA